MGKGMVYLVGAGPGDRKLITVKGLECIQKADVLVYDRLVSRRLLSYARPDCELIYGGKYPDHHILRQGEINEVLVAKALAGKIVTRLKGGDPFVFGRGGEEAEALVKAGIAFEVVPGITSAISVPAYAGIPVTHREYTTSFAVITGHLNQEKAESEIHWDKIAQAHGTLIFLMGMEKLPMIMEKLQEFGRNSKTPVALVRWGTTAGQRTVTGCIDNIVEVARSANFGSPAVVIVGEVVNLRQQLQWFETKPLFGRRVVVTRARSQASKLSNQVEDLGGEAWEFPVIETVEPEDYSLLDSAITRLSEFTWLIFTSVNGVEFFFRRLKRLGKDIRELAGIKICTIGPATKQAVEDYHLLVDLVPEEYRAEGILDVIKERLNPQDRVLLPRAEVARETLPEALTAQGISLEVVPAYRTIMGNGEAEGLKEMLRQNMIDVVTFTSSSTVKNFVQLMDSEDLPRLLENVTIASIGPITSDTARKAGLKVDVEATEYTIAGLLQAVVEHLHNK